MKNHGMWNAIVELDEPVRSERVDELMESLAEYSVTMTTSELGRLVVIVSLPAKNIAQACTTALAVVAQAAGAAPRSVQVMATADYDITGTRGAIPEIVGAAGAAEMLGVSRQAVLDLVDRGRLPHARAGKVVVIPAAAVRAWAQRRKGSVEN